MSNSYRFPLRFDLHLENLNPPVQLKDLEVLLSPMLLLLKAVGAYHCPGISSGVTHQISAGSGQKWLSCCHRINWKLFSLFWIFISGCFYSWRVVNLYIRMADVIGAFSSIHHFAKLFGCVTWTIEMMVLSLAMFFASSSSAGLPKLHKLWKAIRLYRSEAEEVEGFVKRWLWIALGAFVVMVTVQLAVGPAELRTMGRSSIFPAIVPFVLATVVEGGVLYFLILLMMTVSKVLSILNQRITSQFETTGGIFSLDNFLHNYYLIVAFVHTLSTMFSFALGLYIPFRVISLIFKSYTIVSIGCAAIYPDTTVFWYIISSSYLMSLLWIGAEIPLKATELHYIIHAVSLDQYPVCQQNKILSLQHFMGSTTVSLTIFKVYPVTRGLFSSIVGFCLSYLFILIQFPKD